MYSLDINFLKDRPTYQKNFDKKERKPIKLGNLTPVYVGVGVGLFFPIVLGCGLGFLQARTGDLQQQVAKLDSLSKSLDSKLGDINKIKQDTENTQQETQALVTVFNQIRPWSAMLQDLRDRIPTTVQIETIKQIAATVPPPGKQVKNATNPDINPAGGIEIQGSARSFNDVENFLLSLQQSHFLNSTKTEITTADLEPAPLSTNSAKTKPPEIVKYTIQSSLSAIPASDLIQELEKKGAVGLVARIREIKQIGVILK